MERFTFTDRCRPIAQIGIGDTRQSTGQARWDVARWDTEPHRWAGTEPTWMDISCHVRTARCEYGRRRTTDRFVPGVATVVVDNTDGWADPRNSVDVAGVLSMRPGRPIRFGVVHVTLGTRWLFRGFIDAIVPNYSPTDADTVTFDCIDALGEVNRAKLPGVEPPVGDGETIDVRINRLLDLIGWAPQKRDVRPTALTLVADDLGGQMADLLGQAADSGGGSVFGDTEGRVVFRSRDWQTYVPGTPPDGTIGNVDPTDVCPTSWERPFARADIATRAIMGRGSEPPVVRDDAAAQLRYGIEPFERTDLLSKLDSTLALLADRALITRGVNVAPRVRAVTLDARTSTSALDLMASVDVYRPSRYRCRLRLPRGDVFDAEHFATGVVHELDPSSWTLGLSLDLAAPFAADGARWDRARWNRNTWVDAT